jgi:hypothetical protein
MNPNDSVSWATLPLMSPPAPDVFNPFSIVTTNGLDTVTGSSPSLPGDLFAENAQGFSDVDLIDSTSGAALTLGFSTPVSAAGAEIQSEGDGDFTAFLTAFNSSGSSLGTFQVGGTSPGPMFLGATDASGADIASIEFSTTNTGGNSGPIIGTLELNTLGTTTAVPLPSSIWGGLALFGGLAAWHLGRRARIHSA